MRGVVQGLVVPQVLSNDDALPSRVSSVLLIRSVHYCLLSTDFIFEFRPCY
jgi:hypothetical protein